MTKPVRLPDEQQQELLNQTRVKLATREQLPRINELLDQHHYLGTLRPVGERLYYIATDAADNWLALLVFNAAANHLKHRDDWIGWSREQLRRRRSLITNNSRFLVLSEGDVPNLGSRVLRLTLDRLSQDWQEQYGHPILVVETFVDPEKFCGTVYTANGWIELGQTDGWARCQRDYYVKHDKPKLCKCVSDVHCSSMDLLSANVPNLAGTARDFLRVMDCLRCKDVWGWGRKKEARSCLTQLSPQSDGHWPQKHIPPGRRPFQAHGRIH